MSKPNKSYDKDDYKATPGADEGDSDSPKPPKVDAYAIWNMATNGVERLVAGGSKKDAEAELESALSKHGEAEPDYRIVHIKEV